MKQLFPLVWAGLKSRKHTTVLLLSTIILSVVFLVVMGMISSSSLYTLEVQNKDAYGEQKAVVWHLNDVQKAQTEASSVWERIGKMKIYSVVNTPVETDTVFGIGTIDAQAMELGHIRLAEGRLPEAANEVVLEKNVYKYMGTPPYNLGDSILLDGISYTVVGFLENYSAVWQNTYLASATISIPSPVTVSFLISEAGTQQFAHGCITETWLLSTSENDYAMLNDAMPKDVSFALNAAVYSNLADSDSMDGHTLNTISTGALVGGMIMVCMMMILLNGFILSLDRRKKQFSLLRCIGATKKQACNYIFCEGFLLMGMGIPAGLLVGALLSYGAVKGFAVLSGVTLRYQFNPWILLIATVVCVICVCIALLIPAIRASKSTPVAGIVQGSLKRKHKPRNARQWKVQLSPFALMLVSIRKSKGKILLTSVAFALVITIFTFMMLFYLVAYQTTYETADVTLSEPNVFFYGKYVVSENLEDTTDLTELMGEVATVIPVAYQNVEVRANFACQVPFSQYDSYLNGYYQFDAAKLGLSQKAIEQNASSMEAFTFSIQQRYGYSNQEYLIVPRVTVLDDGLLQMASFYVADGNIDIEAINRGEEIVLCMPDYMVEIIEHPENDGYWASSFGWGQDSLPETEHTKTYTNTQWKAGDTLTFTWVEERGETYEQYHKTVRIGAVLNDYIPMEGNPGFFGILVGAQTLENLELPYQTFSQHIYFQGDGDAVQAEKELQQYVVQRYSHLGFTTNAEVNAPVQQTRRTAIAAISLVIICLLALGFLGLVNTVSSRIHNRLHEIGLLRSIGMTKGQVYRMLVYEGVAFGLLASLLGAITCFLILPHVQWYWLQTQTPLYLALACVVCIALSVLTIFLPARNVLENSPTEITHSR